MSATSEPWRRHWFPVALSNELQKKPQRVLLFDHPVALARTSDGKAFALEDRCPHRGAPLSAGCVEADALVCPYHGWSFNSAGLCAAMPGADNPGSIGPRAVAWQVEERDGIVWICEQPARPLADRLLAMDPRRRRFLWQTTWQAPVLEAQDNFLDALHTHRVHPGLVRRESQRSPVSVHTRGSRDGFQIDYTGQQSQSGLLFRLFESPRTRERAHFSGLSVAQLEYRYASGWAAFITLCFSPASAFSTHVFTMLHVEDRFAPSWLVRLLVWPFLRKVAMQDRQILNLQSTNLAHFPSHRHIVTPVDVARPLLERAWRGESLEGMTERQTTIWI